MIQGEITPDNEAIIPLQIRDANGQILALDIVIDTGFSGHLTLPADLITALQLPFRQRQTHELGDGSLVEFDVYRGVVVWEGQDRIVAVLAAEGGGLIGMRLLRGHRLLMDIVDGGIVTIEPHP
jgi:clan AA aspartic protease